MMLLWMLVSALVAQDPEIPVEIEENGRQLHSRVSWSSRIEAIAPLSAHLRRDLAARRATLLPGARSQEADARRRRYPFVQHVLGIDWRTQGVTPQLISLSAETSVTQGGGHSTDGYDVLLWDMLRGQPIPAGRLIDPAALTARFCAAYREATRDEARTSEAGESPACPNPSALPIAPADGDGNGRFDTIRFFIAPSSYFEADGFSVDLPVEDSDIARMPDGYRPAFEVPGGRPTPPASG